MICFALFNYLICKKLTFPYKKRTPAFICYRSSWISFVPRALFCIDGQYDHQCPQGIFWIEYFNFIRVAPMHQLFGYHSDLFPWGIKDTIIPSHEIPFYLPAIIIDMVSRPKPRKILWQCADMLSFDIQLKTRQKRQQLFLYHADFLMRCVMDLQACLLYTSPSPRDCS